MNATEFKATLADEAPPPGLETPVEALWWDAKGNWERAHEMVNDLSSPQAMAVHAYLHRREGDLWNADYWYRRAGRGFHRQELADEWDALVDGLLGG